MDKIKFDMWIDPATNIWVGKPGHTRTVELVARRVTCLTCKGTKGQFMDLFESFLPCGGCDGKGYILRASIENDMRLLRVYHLQHEILRIQEQEEMWEDRFGG